MYTNTISNPKPGSPMLCTIETVSFIILVKHTSIYWSKITYSKRALHALLDQTCTYSRFDPMVAWYIQCVLFVIFIF